MPPPPAELTQADGLPRYSIIIIEAVQMLCYVYEMVPWAQEVSWTLEYHGLEDLISDTLPRPVILTPAGSTR
jgi:hypothetical protein